MNVKFRTNQGEKIGEVIKDNMKTVLVKFKYKKNVAEEGAKAIFKKFTTTIKRHKIKHNVQAVEI